MAAISGRSRLLYDPWLNSLSVIRNIGNIIINFNRLRVFILCLRMGLQMFQKGLGKCLSPFGLHYYYGIDSDRAFVMKKKIE